MTREEAQEFLTNISYSLGNMSVEYLTEKDGEKMREAIVVLKQMTYSDIYNEFCKKFPNAEVSDYRPAMPQYLPRLVKPIPYAIVVWLKDGSKMVYIAEEAKDD